MITMDEDGEVKRKVKRVKVEHETSMSGFLMPDKDAKRLDMNVFPIVAPSPNQVWVAISLTILVTTTTH